MIASLVLPRRRFLKGIPTPHNHYNHNDHYNRYDHHDYHGHEKASSSGVLKGSASVGEHAEKRGASGLADDEASADDDDDEDI